MVCTHTFAFSASGKRGTNDGVSVDMPHLSAVHFVAWPGDVSLNECRRIVYLRQVDNLNL